MSIMALVDGSSCFMRAWCVLPEDKRSGEDLAYMVGRMLLRMIRRTRADYLGVALDSQPYWRSRYHPEYKGPREHATLSPNELTDIIAPYLRRWRVPMMVEQGQEADDHLYTMAASKKPGTRLYLCTKDSDMFCALKFPDVELLWPEKGEYLTLDAAYAEQKLGFPGALLPQVRALTADQKDNIRGVFGTDKGWRCPINRKRAAELLTVYGDIFGIIDSTSMAGNGMKPKEVEYVGKFSEQIVLAWQLTTLRTDAKSGVEARDCDVRRFAIDIPEE